MGERVALPAVPSVPRTQCPLVLGTWRYMPSGLLAAGLLDEAPHSTALGNAKFQRVGGQGT
jgi:hypothetical protein